MKELISPASYCPLRLDQIMQPIQKEVDEEWKKTAEERISEIKTGNVKVIPGNEVFNEIKDKYGR
ncbi:addiction module protein [Syntrophaceticus schinkii]|uniref:addiction module protein n=1 Tax=Syntrophaceticus schinkii TaxID=499207 RepID=UPI001E3E41C8|nr:addiction module protein [Syntrophaceticus schinkii]